MRPSWGSNDLRHRQGCCKALTNVRAILFASCTQCEGLRTGARQLSAPSLPKLTTQAGDKPHGTLRGPVAHLCPRTLAGHWDSYCNESPKNPEEMVPKSQTSQ